MVRDATARRLDFGEMETRAQPVRVGRAQLSLATTGGLPAGPDKYRVLDLKRRRAQIRARRALGVM
jgi:hypothetical protein